MRRKRFTANQRYQKWLISQHLVQIKDWWNKKIILRTIKTIPLLQKDDSFASAIGQTFYKHWNQEISKLSLISMLKT